MNIKEIDKKFTEYKKWLNTLLMKEYFNLPFKKQKEFIPLIEDLLQNCKKINEEAINIEEKMFPIKVKNVITLHTGDYLITGDIQGKEEKTVFPSSEPKPQKGSLIKCILYSIKQNDTNERFWYSSKTDLMKEVHNG